MKTGEQFTLTTERRKSLLLWISEQSIYRLLICGFGIYVGVALLFTLLELALPSAGNITTAPAASPSFLELLYFNFVSILTIGFGDFAPQSWFRLFTVLEAMAGLTIYSIMTSILTVKLFTPPKHTIVFSKYAYYCTKDDAFMVIYLNTSNRPIQNLETSWYFKLDEDWQTGTPVKVPFITTSVQTFYLGYAAFESFKNRLHKYDCLRVGLSGNSGMFSYSTSVQYDLEDILVIDDRSELTRYEGFYQVDEYLSTETFENYFHYQPPNAPTLASFARST